MVRLVGETAAVAASGTYLQSRQFLLQGLSELISADAWIWSLSRVDPESKRIYFLTSQNDGLEPQQIAHISEAVEHPEMVEATMQFATALLENQSPITMHREQIDANGVSRDGELQIMWDKTGLDGLIMSGHPLDKDSYSHIVMYRKAGTMGFTDREAQIAHIVLSEVSWLHAMGWPEDRGVTIPKLTPRQRSVLIMLTEGCSRKEMAAAMRISEGTISGYVKEVYRHFGVHSQTELVKKFSGAA